VLGIAVLALGLAAALAGTAEAQFTMEAIVMDGDAVDGVGNTTSIDAMAINNSGVWIVESDTDNPDTDADGVLLRNGRTVYLREGDPLSDPAGTTIDNFDSVYLNSCDESAWNLGIDGTGGIFDDSGIYYFDQLLIQESDFSTSPGLSPDTPYIGFFEVKINDAGQLLAMSSVDDVAINSTVDRVLMLIETDGVDVLSETVIVKEGDILAGQVDPLTDLSTGPHGFDFNNSGDALYQADISGGATDAIYLNAALLAREGDSAPVAGRLWDNLADPEMTLNNLGDYVHNGTMDGDTSTNSIIVSNGVKVVQEGDTLADISPSLLTSFGSGPIHINDAGDILWYGDWDDSNTDIDTGLFLNDQLIVQEGITTVGGLVVDTLRGVSEGYTTSDDGRYILFEAVLDGGIDAAVLITMDGLTAEDPSPGMAGMNNTFTVSGGEPGANIALLAGLGVGSTEIPGCPGLKLGLTNPVLLGTGIGGDFNFDRTIPGNFSGRTIHLQAVDRTNCTLGNLNTFDIP